MNSDSDEKLLRPQRKGEELPTIDEDVGRVVNRVRRERGVTLVELERLTGISNSQLSKLERGQGRWLVQHLARISSALGVSIRDLIPGGPDDSACDDERAAELRPEVRAIAVAHARDLRRLSEDQARILERMASDLEGLVGEG